MILLFGLRVKEAATPSNGLGEIVISSYASRVFQAASDAFGGGENRDKRSTVRCMGVVLYVVRIPTRYNQEKKSMLTYSILSCNLSFFIYMLFIS